MALVVHKRILVVTYLMYNIKDDVILMYSFFLIDIYKANFKRVRGQFKEKHCVKGSTDREVAKNMGEVLRVANTWEMPHRDIPGTSSNIGLCPSPVDSWLFLSHLWFGQKEFLA